MNTPQYGLSTAIAMIVGIVIGSGIFFKSDNILIATGGNVPLGIVLFILAALGIVFGSLTIAQLAGTTEATGGVIAYFEEAWGPQVAAAFGWFQVFIYFPTLTAVIGWVLGTYISDFFHLGSSLLQQCLLGALLIVLLFLLNITAARLGGLLQNASALIKLLPLVLVAAAGLIFGDSTVLSAPLAHPAASSGWLSAVGPVAFSFDGWIIATAISHEIKNAKRNLPLALVCAPLVILVVYIAYFLGICALLGPQTIMNLGDSHVALAAHEVFGPLGGKLIMVFIIISVLGTLNGIILGSIRLPHALAQRHMLPASRCFCQLNDHFGTPLYSAWLALALALLWLLLHFITQSGAFLPNSDISETFIIISYVLYMALYGKVIAHWRLKRQSSLFFGLIAPILAIIGSLFILYCGLQTPHFILGLCFSVFIMISGAVFFRLNQREP